MKLTRDYIRGLNAMSLASARINYETGLPKCKVCLSNSAVVKFGHDRHNVQRFLCKRCDKVFLANDNLPQMRFSAHQIGDVLGQYYGGMSLKELKRQFEQQHNLALSRSTFDRWLNRFSDIAIKEAKKQQPKVGDVWLADECVLKINGKQVWCWDIIDGDTRYLLGTHLSYTRTTEDAKKLMEKALKVAGKPPKVVITDSLRAYIDGIELTFGGETTHVQSEPFNKDGLSTNKIERWHSTLRTRTDIMRGLKSLKTAQILLDGWLVHYNYFRPHESLNDHTPAEACQVKYPYKDWLEVVQSQELSSPKRLAGITFNQSSVVIPKVYSKRQKKPKIKRRYRRHALPTIQRMG